MMRLLYRPNPAHKTTTTEAGPPKWRPDKSACPEDLGPDEINTLINNSVSETDDPMDPRRFSVRRTAQGLEWYRSLLTRRHPEEGIIEIHGHPFEPGYPKVPPTVLRSLRERDLITAGEYKQMVKA